MSSSGDQKATETTAQEDRPGALARAPVSSEQSTADLHGRLGALDDRLERVYRTVHGSEELASKHPRVVEWLLDNEYLVRRGLRQARNSVPPSFERRLPRLADGPDAGRTRIGVLAEDLLDSADRRLDRDDLLRYVDAFQALTPLSIAELWALPAYLRTAALSRLTDVASALLSPERTAPLDRTGGPGSLGTGGDDISPARETGSCVESLRWLDEQDWRPVFERLSRVESELSRDPSGHYPAMEFETRDRYRKAVEEVSRWSGRSEPEVAATACDLARDPDPAEGRRTEASRHVGHYLVGDGRPELEDAAGADPPGRVRLRRWVLRRGVALHFGTVGLLTALLLIGFGALLPAAPISTLFLLAATVPAVTVAVALTHRAVTYAVPSRPLPKLELEGDVPPDWRTAVVVPCLLTDEEEVDELLEKLEVLYEGNGGSGELTFGLLSDFTDAPRKEMPEDGRLVRRARRGVAELNRRYGGSDHTPFFLLHRERLWNPAEECWMGWERKRGKLEEFNRLILGEGETSYCLRVGATENLSDVRFALTLDADTRVPPGEAHRLIGTLAHPLNRPSLDEDGEVRSGYTILQPRLQSAPPAEGFTPFARIQEGNTGLDLYSHAVSDVYQDLFGEGIFVGKGIYHVESFHRTTADRVPENALLSHDIFEGICGRSGLVSDVVFLEDYPDHVLTYLRRLHRWVRGDWQWLPWLLPRVPTPEGSEPNPFGLLDRWKIADNIRRSLLSPSLVLLAAAGWIAGVGSPWLWTGLVLAVPGVPVIIGAADATTRPLFRQRTTGGRRSEEPTLGSRLRRVGQMARLHLERWGLSTALLLAESVVAADAVGRTLVRLTVTRKHLLEWTAAAQAARRASSRAAEVWLAMRRTAGTAVALTGLVWLGHPSALPAAAPLLAAWFLSPHVSHLVSRRTERRPEELSTADRRFLRGVALRTWMFFERHLTSEDHWLPPDHYRESGDGQLARRTSPTNIGLALTSSLAAWDLGFVGPLSLEASLRNTLEGMDRLYRYRGHFLNWYSTRDLSPLDPRYVSTVDSGNLAASLVVLSEGVGQVAREPVLRPEQVETLSDVLRILAETLEELDREGGLAGRGGSLVDRLRATRSEVAGLDDDPAAFGRALARLAEERLPAIEVELSELIHRLDGGPEGPASRDELQAVRIWSRKLNQQVRHTLREARTAVPWLTEALDPPAAVSSAPEDSRIGREWRHLRELLSTNPALDRVPELADRALARLRELEDAAGGDDGGGGETCPDGGAAGEVAAWARSMRDTLESGAERARRLASDLSEVAEIANRTAREMDFRFLYDDARDLFHLGFDVSSGELDSHHYDLLASEARLAGLFAVSRGDAPPRHWLHLGRPFGPDSGAPTLLSWGGSMFEYLLPAQFTRTPPGSLLDRSYRQAVRAHIHHGRRHGVPWGLSEAAFRKPSDPDGYGYRAFGVPALALRRGADDPLVVAPYASALALPFRPAEATRNLRRLRDRGMLAHYGFFESLDFGSPRERTGEGEPVRALMAHHHGMTLLGIDNCLSGRPMVDRFHDAPRIAAVEHLLHEQAPWQVPVERPWTPPERTAAPDEAASPVFDRWSPPGESARPQVQLLSNGSYRVLLTASGSGGSYRGERSLTRWEPDPTREERGCWIYLQDRDSDRVWSVGRAPAEGTEDDVSCEMAPHEVRLRRREEGVSAETRVAVAPGADVEIRHLTISNSTARRRSLTVSSYGEVSLAPPADDLRHPAYSKLFVEARALPERRTLLYRRRSREGGESSAWLAHYLVGATDRTDGDGVRWETDRERFLGRNGDLASPRGLRRPEDDGDPGRPGDSLDPIFSLSADLELPPFGSRKLAFVTAAADSEEEVLDLRARFDGLGRLEGALEDAEGAAAERMDRLGLEGEDGRLSQELLSALLHPTPGLDGRERRPDAQNASRHRLWALGVSGDHPILLARIPSTEEAAFADRLLRMHRYWSDLGLPVDLTLLHGERPGYVQPVRDRVEAVLDRMGPGPGVGDDGGIHLISSEGAAPDEVAALERAAAVVLDAGGPALSDQLGPVRRPPDSLPAFVPVPSSPGEPDGETPPLPEEELAWDNGFGGLSEDGSEFVVRRDPDRPTPAPWINVVANPEFGFLASESSLGCTWSQNSGERRLTPWRNDPVLDAPSEVLYLRDEEMSHVWSATPLPAGDDRPYRVRHAAGYTAYRHHRRGLVQELRVTVADDDPVKIAALEVENRSDRPRRVTATYYAEWVLGARRSRTVGWLAPGYDGGRQALLARNTGDPTYGDRTAFLTSDHPPHGLTADRTEFLGRSGGLEEPEALGRIGLSDRVPPDGDPCAAYQVHLDLSPGERATVHFVLGDGRDREHALELASRYSDAETAEGAARRQREAWEERLGRLTVRTPDEDGLDALVNRWLPYQALSSRMWARTAHYQSSGAFGFRDQLQDSLALLHAAPGVARSHLLRAARHQFEEGDVLHWWHPNSGRGVRTRCSDDLLWLPFVVVRYVEATGDHSVLEESVPFLEAPDLGPGEAERYEQYGHGDSSASLYEHCLRALGRGLTAGPRGLPLIGTGDWNDGMNRVGRDGRGESVWLGWFLCRVLRDVAGLAAGRGEEDRARDLRDRADALAGRLEEAGWDGSWYRRAYYDDGTPLGSAQNAEARIDAISQAWAVLSEASRPERAAAAMEAVDRELVRPDDRLVLLLTPPFRDSGKDPGYIRAYPPGVRENGGQYTHAAAWVGWAFADLGDAERTWKVLRYLNPLARSDTPERAERYAVEPYVQCADVYGAEPFTGRGGWTWYTGSAAWTWRLAVERILGLQREGDSVRLDPCPPPGWDGWEMHLRDEETEWRIEVRVSEEGQPGVQRLELDGEGLEGDSFPLRPDGGTHRVVARVGRPRPTAGPEPDGGADGS